jgi:hypothetical protein
MNFYHTSKYVIFPAIFLVLVDCNKVFNQTPTMNAYVTDILHVILLTSHE